MVGLATPADSFSTAHYLQTKHVLCTVIEKADVIFFDQEAGQGDYNLSCAMIESLTSLGAKVVLVASSDENHPPENIIDG